MTTTEFKDFIEALVSARCATFVTIEECVAATKAALAAVEHTAPAESSLDEAAPRVSVLDLKDGDEVYVKATVTDSHGFTPKHERMALVWAGRSKWVCDATDEVRRVRR